MSLDLQTAPESPDSVFCALSHFSCVQLFAASWTCGFLCPWDSPGKNTEWVAISSPGTEPESLMSPVLAGGFFTTSATWETILSII